MTPTRGTQWNYTCSNKGLLLPLVSEFTWSIEFRVVVYVIGMLECFLGVAIVADIFMCAIEKITSKTKIITKEINGQPESIEVKVWNDTVANLTLMALGSSAPEIILTTYETIGNNFEPGDLGPSSVVGAAGFNLLVITAACILAIPRGEVRKIKSMKVYCVTSFFGIFAYVWLLLILVVCSPDVIDLWEACLTLAFFPIMVLLAYVADRNFFLGRGIGKEMYEFGRDRDRTAVKNSILDTLKRIRKDPGLTETDAASLAARRMVNERAHSRMWYRVGAIRKITGGKRAKPVLNSNLRKIYLDMSCKEQSQEQRSKDEVDTTQRTDVAVIEFVKSSIAAWENAGHVFVEVRRTGKLDEQAVCSIETYDGTAKSGEDYVPLKETITFRPYEEVRTVNVMIIDDNQWEDDENFFLKLTIEDSSRSEVIGKKNVIEIIILDDDNPGSIEFDKEDNFVKFSSEVASIPLRRTKGADGLVTVRWQTLDQTAVAGRNYKKSEEEVIFQHGETKREIDILLFGGTGRNKELHFQVELLDTTGGAVLGEPKKANVHITDDLDFNSALKRVETLTESNMESSDITTDSWTEQLKSALSVNGGDIGNATRSDFFMHFLTFGWKVIFAFIPPTSYLGGWLTFAMALCMIGVLTAVIGDMASIFGCLVGLKDSVTAITLVALGTSLPDLFASKSAAFHEKHADSAVGNVNGSNSVNVFLGLGVPWLISSIYWISKGGQVSVPKGSLSFSVAVYGACAIVCFILLMTRRFSPLFGKAELGGPRRPAVFSSLVCISLWMFYVLISSFEAYGYINI